MKKYQNSTYPDDWRAVAKKDWNRIERNLAEQDVEAAGFYLQQALEKYLKAYLLERNWKLRKIHSLTTLLDYVIEHNPQLERFRALCERVTDYYFIERYPLSVEGELTSKEIERDLEEAREFIQAMFPEEVLND